MIKALCVLVACMPLMAGTRTVSLVDVSPEGTPIENKGFVTLTEQNANGMASMSRQYDWTAKNVSEKSLVALVAKLRVQYSNGTVSDITSEYDAFFHPQVIEPGGLIDLSNGNSGIEISKQRDSDPTEPRGEVTVLWAQFLDGSTLGDAKYAASILELRRGIWDALSHLDKVSEQQGPEEFVRQLNQPYPESFVNEYLESFRSFQREHDTQGAIGRIEEHLRIAEGRSQLLHPVPN